MVAALGVILDPKLNCQKFFGGSWFSKTKKPNPD